ncbi:helix-turn-helix domain-containing protein [Streptomyces sp. NPDC023588]|uniref:helix-turn-helix domain-containing protein n=1 Tax=Streptomyces sp. NPDC023588 TaxID=3154907 RepID=UPI0033FA2E78
MGNHLLQHPDLSAMAIGVAAYIQSLPDGVPVGIKALAGRFPEGEVRIASALRELERHGYLERRRERLEGGRVVTRTYSHNRPGAVGPDGPPLPEPPPPPPPPPVREPVAEAVLEPVPEEASRPAAEPLAPPSAEPRPHPEAVGLLAGLRRYDPRLLLSERDVQRLAPRASVWLERGLDPDAVARALAANLPAPMHHPAAVLAYRLTALLPPCLPPAPAAPAATAVRPGRQPDPFQTCDGCERAFRAPHPGRCRTCSAEARAAA